MCTVEEAVPFSYPSVHCSEHYGALNHNVMTALIITGRVPCATALGEGMLFTL